MAIVTKFGAGLFNARNDATAWDELEHLDVGSESGFTRFGFMVGATTPGFTGANMHWSFGTSVVSGNGNSDKAYGAARNRDGLSSPDRDSASNNGVHGPAYIEPAATTVYHTNARSSIPGGFNIARTSSNFVNSPLYISAVGVGSMTAFTQWFPMGSVASGTTATVSMGFTPDLVLAFGLGILPTIGFFHSQDTWNAGMIDCRCLDHQQGFNHAYWNITNKNPLMRLDTGSGFISLPTASGQLETQFSMRVTSTDANGLHTQVWKNDFSVAGSTHICFMGFKFNEAAAHFRVGKFSIVGSETVTQTLQINSLNPQFIYAIGTNIQSLNFTTASLSTEGENVSFGLATDAGNNIHVTISDQASLTATNNFTFAHSNDLLNTFGISDGNRYTIGDLTFLNNAISYVEGRSPSLHPDEKVLFFAFGESTNAQSHLQDESGVSIFLHEQGLQGDDLLLGPVPLPPVAGLPVNRDFPLDTRRDYPTRINTIRDYPVN